MTARDLALLELDERRLPGWPAHTLPRRFDRRTPLADPRDRALAEQIHVGVVKNLLLLHHLVQRYSRRSLDKVDVLVQKILAIGLYQLRFLDRIPASAAVDEAVEQAKRVGRGKAAGFVNAVLRRAARQRDVPLPSASDKPAEYARIVLSHPPELISRLEKLVGKEQALRICEHDNAEPPTTVRLFPGIDPSQLAAPGVAVRPHEQPGMYVIEPAKQPLLAEWSRRAIAQTQDPTAATVVDLCRIQPGQMVLDRCAGLGTKTMQMRQQVGDAGRVVAIDPSEVRCDVLRHLAADRGISNIQVCQSATLKPLRDVLPASFDRILVDAPCSNSGVLARRPEARYAQNDDALRSLVRLQLDILEDTANWLKPGGLLVYSTCSLWPEENQDVVAKFLESHDDFAKIEERSILPSIEFAPERYHDGGYVAVLERRSTAG